MTNDTKTKSFIEVRDTVRKELQEEYGVTDAMITAMRQRVEANIANLGHTLPNGTSLVAINALWFDYTVQRHAIIKHILKIMKNYDPRLHGPASACRVGDDPRVLVYDGQQRSLARALLGYDSVPGIVIDTNDVTFPSYAFESLNETGVEKLLPGDLHRNALTRYGLGARDERSMLAFTMQEQFNKNNVDLEDKRIRSSKMRGQRPFYFSHFAYAIKVAKVDQGKMLHNILEAIATTFSNDEEINQDLFIGLFEIARLDNDNGKTLPDGWMLDVMKKVAGVFPVATTVDKKSLFKLKAKQQLEHITPGAGWEAPRIMANFLREIYIYAGGTLKLPYHGIGSQLQINSNPVPGLLPMKTTILVPTLVEADAA